MTAKRRAVAQRTMLRPTVLRIFRLTAALFEKCGASVCHGFRSNLILRILKICLLFGFFFAAAYCVGVCLAPFPSSLLDARRWASVIPTPLLVKSLGSLRMWGGKRKRRGGCTCAKPLLSSGECGIKKLSNKEVLLQKGRRKEKPSVWDFNYALFLSPPTPPPLFL